MYASGGPESEQQTGNVLDEVGRTGTWEGRPRGCLGCPVGQRRWWCRQRGGGEIVVLPTAGTLGSRAHPLATEEHPDPELRHDRNDPEPGDGVLDEA